MPAPGPRARRASARCPARAPSSSLIGTETEVGKIGLSLGGASARGGREHSDLDAIPAAAQGLRLKCLRERAQRASLDAVRKATLSTIGEGQLQVYGPSRKGVRGHRLVVDEQRDLTSAARRFCDRK